MSGNHDISSEAGDTREAGGDLATQETARLIASDKVEGTAVYDHADACLGAVRNVMIDKYTGHVAYAVVSFGGFLGIGEQYHPIPWGRLRYEPRLGGYVADLTVAQLEKAPRYDTGQSPWSNPSYGQSISDYYDKPHAV